MLLSTLNLLVSSPITFLKVFPVLLATVGAALLVSITVHEFSHALAAALLGDRTAQRSGRLSLNPLRHLDPMGSLLLLLVGFGWGKPVPVNPMALRGGRRGAAAVAAAGPLSNGLAAFLFALPIKLGVLGWQPPLLLAPFFSVDLPGSLAEMAALVIFFNVLLGVFNLLPLFPLDGSRVAIGLLPRQLASRLERWEAYGPAILFLVIAVDAFTHLGILQAILGPVVNYAGKVIVGRDLF